jgi:hypothetical protein
MYAIMTANQDEFESSADWKQCKFSCIILSDEDGCSVVKNANIGKVHFWEGLFNVSKSSGLMNLLY